MVAWRCVLHSALCSLVSCSTTNRVKNETRKNANDKASCLSSRTVVQRMAPSSAFLRFKPLSPKLPLFFWISDSCEPVDARLLYRRLNGPTWNCLALFRGMRRSTENIRFHDSPEVFPHPYHCVRIAEDSASLDLLYTFRLNFHSIESVSRINY